MKTMILCGGLVFMACELMYYAPKSMLPEEDYAVFRKKNKN